MTRFRVSSFAGIILAGMGIAVGAAFFLGLTYGKKAESRPNIVTVGSSKNGRVVAEFEHQDAIILGFNELVDYHPETLVEIVKAIKSRVKIIGLLKTDEQSQRVDTLLRGNGIDPAGILYFVWPANMMWVRDFSPIFLVDDKVTVVDFAFHGENNDFENLFPIVFAARFNFPYTHSHVTFDGGNFLSNGQGVCLSTSTVISINSAERKLIPEAIAERIGGYFHFDRWTYLVPLKDEPTGHVDTFATFVSPNQIVVGSYEVEQDPENAMILDKNAATLATLKTAHGQMNVTRIKRPPNSDGHWRSYTNVIFANGVLLVPQYPTVAPDLDREAIETYKKLLPEWDVIGIDATSIIAKRGALHCIYATVPRLPLNAQ